MKIFIDPRTNVVYASLYIHGLYQIYGKQNVKFAKKPFAELKQKNGIEDFDHYFAFIVETSDNKVKKIAIDFRDKISINEPALLWCDVYGKVNYNRAGFNNTKISETAICKIIAIGPNFGVKIWNNAESFYYFLSNYFRSRTSLPVGLIRFFFSYFLEMRRARIKDYLPSSTNKEYVFFISSLRINDRNNGETSRLRSLFIKNCKKITSKFEGGLYSKKFNSIDTDHDIMTAKSVSHVNFIKKTRLSNVVFNTPAVWSCHGWKLGEYLAMGKAIISTPLSNEMPKPLLHGIHVHFVSNDEELTAAIRKIIKDENYRKTLEKGASLYYKNYIEPQIVLSKLIGN